jgi:hypothetical protein
VNQVFSIVYLARHGETAWTLSGQFMGTDYWHEILRFIEQMAKAGMIAPSDMQVVYVTDSVDDAIAHIRSHSIERFALLAVRRVRPHWRWLGERGLPPPLIALSNLRPPGPPARRLPP